MEENGKKNFNFRVATTFFVDNCCRYDSWCRSLSDISSREGRLAIYKGCLDATKLIQIHKRKSVRQHMYIPMPLKDKSCMTRFFEIFIILRQGISHLSGAKKGLNPFLLLVEGMSYDFLVVVKELLRDWSIVIG